MTTVNHFLDTAFSGFWAFVGSMILLYLVLWIPSRLIFIIVNRTLRHLNIRKHGWPPSHLDADGDWRPSQGEG